MSGGRKWTPSEHGGWGGGAKSTKHPRHTDEKGRSTAAKSKVAKSMRQKPYSKPPYENPKNAHQRRHNLVLKLRAMKAAR